MGEAIRRPPRRGGAGRVRITLQNLEAKAKSPNLKAIICLRHLQSSKSESLAPPIIPPGGQRIPPGRPKSTTRPAFFSINILIIFWTRFLIDFGPFWGAKLKSFSALFAPKIVPRRVLRPLFFEKVDFSKNERHPRREHDFDPQDRPRCGQDRPKTAPRGS